jgi:RNA polymerase primary sigma factor
MEDKVKGKMSLYIRGFSEDEAEKPKYSKRNPLDHFDTLKCYMKEISRTPLLTAEEEIELGERISNGDESARQMMIKSNLRLVVSIAKDYQNKGLTLMDLISEGNIGLIEAVEKYDYTKNCRFSTYGSWWIKQAIFKSLADKSRVIRIPIHRINLLKRIRRYESEGYSLKEISEMTKKSEEKIKKVILMSEIVSLDKETDREGQTLIEFIKDENQYGNPVEEAGIREEIYEIMNEKLSPKQIRIIEMRYGFKGEPLNLEETGKEFGVTGERIRQIQENALEKMRGSLENRLGKI